MDGTRNDARSGGEVISNVARHGVRLACARLAICSTGATRATFRHNWAVQHATAARDVPSCNARLRFVNRPTTAALTCKDGAVEALQDLCHNAGHSGAVKALLGGVWAKHLQCSVANQHTVGHAAYRWPAVHGQSGLQACIPASASVLHNAETGASIAHLVKVVGARHRLLAPAGHALCQRHRAHRLVALDHLHLAVCQLRIGGWPASNKGVGQRAS